MNVLSLILNKLKEAMMSLKEHSHDNDITKVIYCNSAAALPNL